MKLDTRYRAPIEFVDMSKERVVTLLAWQADHESIACCRFEGTARQDRTIRAPTRDQAIEEALFVGERAGASVTVLLPGHRRYSA